MNHLSSTRLLLGVLAIFLCSSYLNQASKTSKFTKAADQFYAEALETFPSVPGFSIVVVKGDKTVYSKGFGYADLEKKLKATSSTNFYIASCTKSFTALMATLYDQQGLIDLEAPLTQYFPETQFDPALQADKIKVRDLLTHSAGIENEPISYRLAYTGDHSHQKLMDLMNDSKSNKAGFGKFQYDNIGYNIYGLIVEEQLGKTWQQGLEETIFSPLKMERTTAYISRADKNKWPMALPYIGYRPDNVEEVYLKKKDNTMQSAGGLITTADDLANWLKVQINQGKLGNQQVFPKELIQQTQSLLAEDESRNDPFDGKGYGLGWQIGEYQGEKAISHFGGFPGFLTHISFLPEKEIGVAVMVNEAFLGSRIMNIFATYAYDWWMEVDGLDQLYKEKTTSLAEMYEQVSMRYQKGREERAKRTWQLSQSFPFYSGTFSNDQFGTVVIKGSEKEIKVSMGNLHCIATPYTKPETIRVEMIPGSGEVIEFLLEEEKVTGIRSNDMVFQKKM